jgi:acetyltransferase-like isoleucine patch superfamily enzyme
LERQYSDDELVALGLGRVGRNVRLDRTALILNPAGVYIGDDVRIDAFCLVSAFGAGVSVGRHVHIAAGVYIFGGGGVTIDDFAGVSARSIIYSTNDDYSGDYLTGPTLPREFTSVTTAPVHIGRHAVVGAGSVILPGVAFGEGSVCGALSLVKHSVSPFTVVAGTPAREVKSRSRRLLELEREFLLTEREHGS